MPEPDGRRAPPAEPGGRSRPADPPTTDHHHGPALHAVAAGGTAIPQMVTTRDHRCVHGLARACARGATPAPWTWTWTITHRHHHTNQHRGEGGEPDQQHSPASQHPTTPETSRCPTTT